MQLNVSYKKDNSTTEIETSWKLMTGKGKFIGPQHAEKLAPLFCFVAANKKGRINIALSAVFGQHNIQVLSID